MRKLSTQLRQPIVKHTVRPQDQGFTALNAADTESQRRGVVASVVEDLELVVIGDRLLQNHQNSSRTTKATLLLHVRKHEVAWLSA